jgi:hypothetical protein
MVEVVTAGAQANYFFTEGNEGQGIQTGKPNTGAQSMRRTAKFLGCLCDSPRAPRLRVNLAFFTGDQF